jgi:hypothetical protein
MRILYRFPKLSGHECTRRPRPTASRLYLMTLYLNRRRRLTEPLFSASPVSKRQLPQNVSRHPIEVRRNPQTLAGFFESVNAGITRSNTTSCAVRDLWR